MLALPWPRPPPIHSMHISRVPTVGPDVGQLLLDVATNEPGSTALLGHPRTDYVFTILPRGLGLWVDICMVDVSGSSVCTSVKWQGSPHWVVRHLSTLPRNTAHCAVLSPLLRSNTVL